MIHKRCTTSNNIYIASTTERNVIDIDLETRKVYLSGANGALVLIDLSAAFPSLGHLRGTIDLFLGQMKSEGASMSIVV